VKLSMASDELALYCLRQINTFFPDRDVRPHELKPVVDDALERLEACFEEIEWSHYTESGEVAFNHLHTDQYATFLYLVSNSAFRIGVAPDIFSKFYALNKALNCIDIHYEVELPEKILLVHPVGVVLGRANYGNYFTVYQNVTVGSNVSGGSPTIGEGVALFGGSRVVGNSSIGNNCMVSAGTSLINTDVPDNSVALLKDGVLVNKPTKRNVIEHAFRGR
jgi:serine O-acetyltransferase